MKQLKSSNAQFKKYKIVFLLIAVGTLFLLSSCTASTRYKSYVFYELYGEEEAMLSTAEDSDVNTSLQWTTVIEFLEMFSNESKSIKKATEHLQDRENVFSFTIKAFTSGKRIDKYTLLVDIDRQEFQLATEKKMLVYKEAAFNKLMNSGILEEAFPKKDLPEISLWYGEEVVHAQLDGLWNYAIHRNYFLQEDIQNTQVENTELSPYRVEAMEVFQVKLDENIETMPTATYALYNDLEEKIQEKNIVFQGHTAEIELPNKNGVYQLVIEYNWPQKEALDYGVLTQRIFLEVQLPATYTLNQKEYEAGDLVVVYGTHMNSDSTYSFEADVYHNELTWVDQEDMSYLILPLTSKVKAGEHRLKIHENKVNQEVETTELVIHVVDKEFPIQYLKTSSTTASLKSDDNQIEMVKAFERGRASGHEQPLWSGAFLQPVGGRISTEYGTIRYTNDAVESSRHSGIDFANPMGTPIIATEAGYITLSETLAITGETLFIDHGAGVYSQYYHMETREVNVGDYVEKGDIIGSVGTTGFSTGPHLHFTMYNNGVYINPWKLFEAPPF